MRVCPWVRPSVRRSFRHAFFLIAEIDKKQHRIIGKVETLFLDCNNLQKKMWKHNFKTKFQNHFLKQNLFGRIFVRTNLFLFWHKIFYFSSTLWRFAPRCDPCLFYPETSTSGRHLRPFPPTPSPPELVKLSGRLTGKLS